MNEDLVVCSTGTMPSALGKRYHEIDAVLRAAEVIPARDLEVVLHPDWREGLPPRSRQPDAPGVSATLTSDEIIFKLKEGMDRIGIRIHSIHANRDLGSFLNDGDGQTIAGQILGDTIGIAHEVGAEVIVIHPWDSRADEIDLEHIAASIIEASRRSRATLTLENIPLCAAGWSQADALAALTGLVPDTVGLTLDLSWSSMYDNFNELLDLLPRIENVHVQGRLVPGENGDRLHPRAGSINIEAAVRRLCRLGYEGQWTLELNRPRSPEDFRRGVRCLWDLINSDAKRTWGDSS
ncbi:MAG: TIM barrel protein [Bacillota bacterium]